MIEIPGSLCSSLGDEVTTPNSNRVPRDGCGEDESLLVEWTGQSNSLLGSGTVDIPELIADQLQRVGGLRLHSVRPILEPDEHGDPRPVGSGVLLRFKGEHFLL